MSELLTETEAGLSCAEGGFHLDPVRPVERALITHAHGDHARPGSGRYLCAAPSLPLLRRRLGEGAQLQGLEYGERLRLQDVTVSFHPAGHLLGSAQVRLERASRAPSLGSGGALQPAGEVWVVSGDYKREPDPTCLPLEPLRCDVFVTEATYALPIYRWDAPALVAGEIHSWWQANAAQGRPSVLFCWVLGKAQRILAELARLTDRPAWVHGAIEPFNQIYREAGVRLLPTRLVSETQKGKEFNGELILAPLAARGTTWMRRFSGAESAFASGDMRVRGNRRRRSFDRGFALSDHADWPGLLRTVRETSAARVFATHGHRETLVRALREKGIDAAPLAAGLGAEPLAEEAG